VTGRGSLGGSRLRTATVGEVGDDVMAARAQARAAEMMSRHGFLGVPVETFAEAGRRQRDALLAEGLRPDSRVLDIGCGCLRAAYWLIHYLDPGCYHGIEPARVRVEHGLRHLFTAEEVRRQQPRFDDNPRFDPSVFGTPRFDFFLAGSIWTHASKRQIAAMLDSFLRASTAAAVFLASYLAATSAVDDYQGDGWVGTSHESDTPGVIRHSPAWIAEQCRRRALRVDALPAPAFDGQSWLRIRRLGAAEMPSGAPG
jgi:hypothetical protein